MSTTYHSDSHPPQERQPTVRSRANITSACLACKRRKRKCQGGNPCPHCATLKIECCYDERLDKRRKAFNDKARAESDFQRKILDGLLRAIKSEHSETILKMVRADASLDDIAEKLETFDSQNILHNHPSTAQHTHTKDLLPIPSLLQHHQQQQHSMTSQSGIYDPPYSPTRLNTGISRVLDIGELLQPRSSQPQRNNNEPNLPSSPLDYQSDCRLPPLSNLTHKHYQQQEENHHEHNSSPLPLQRQKVTLQRITTTTPIKSLHQIQQQQQEQQPPQPPLPTTAHTDMARYITTSSSFSSSDTNNNNDPIPIPIPTPNPNPNTNNSQNSISTSTISTTSLPNSNNYIMRRKGSLTDRRKHFVGSTASNGLLISPVTLYKGRTC